MFASLFDRYNDDVSPEDMARFIEDDDVNPRIDEETNERYNELRSRLMELEDLIAHLQAGGNAQSQLLKLQAEFQSVMDEIDYLIANAVSKSDDSSSDSSRMEVNDDAASPLRASERGSDFSDLSDQSDSDAEQSSTNASPQHKIPLPDADDFLSVEEERRLLQSSEHAHGLSTAAIGTYIRKPIREFIASFSKPTLPLSVDAYASKRVESYYCSLPYIRRGMIIVDTADLYGASNSKGLGLVTIEKIEQFEFIGFFTGEWELASTLDTVLVETYYYTSKRAGVSNPTVDRPAPDPKRWFDPSFMYKHPVDCIEQYAEQFFFKVRLATQGDPNKGKTGQKRVQYFNGSHLYCIPRIASTKTQDGLSCQLSVDLFDSKDPKFDLMALANHDNKSNTQTLSTFIPHKSTAMYPAIVSTATKRIYPGQEVTIDYGNMNKPVMNTALTRFEPIKVKETYNDSVQQKKIEDANNSIYTYYQTYNMKLPNYAFGPAVHPNSFRLPPDFKYIRRQPDQSSNQVTHTEEELQRYIDSWVTQES